MTEPNAAEVPAEPDAGSLRSPVSRRAALKFTFAATGSLLGGSAFLAACSSGNQPPKSASTEDGKSANSGQNSGSASSASPTKAASTTANISFMAAEYSSKTAPFWKKTIEQFEAANSGIRVNLQVVGWQQMEATTTQRISAGTLPDVVNTASIWLPAWVDSGAIQPITPEILPSSVQNDFVPTFYKNGASYKNEIWGLPFAAAARAMFYNKTLFTKAALDPTRPPKTWAEMSSDVSAIKSKTGDYGYAFDAKGVQAFRYFGFFLWNNGGLFFDPAGKAAFNSTEGVQALQFLVDLVKSGATPNPTAQTIEEIEPTFIGGKLGMLIDGNYLITTIASSGQGLDYGVAGVPVSSEGVTPVTWGVTDVLIISKHANANAVSKFLKYIYQTDVRTTFDVNEGNLPVLQSEQGQPEFQSDAVQQFIKLLPNARFDPLNPNYSKMQTLLTTAIQQAVTGAMNPKDALDAAAKSFNNLTA